MSIEHFQQSGFAVCRGLVSMAKMKLYKEEWDKFRASADYRQDGWNLVEVNIPFGSPLRTLAVELKFNAMQYMQVEDARTYNIRFIVKDVQHHEPVFVHNDVCYHIGSKPKLSAFVAFTSIIPENGGLCFWPGTHKYGYLGDAGEIDTEVLKGKVTPVCPVLAPGDVVFMHSACWHHSGPNTIGLPRVMADIIYADATDPALDLPRDGSLFKRSRVSRIKELEEQCRKSK